MRNRGKGPAALASLIAWGCGLGLPGCAPTASAPRVAVEGRAEGPSTRTPGSLSLTCTLVNAGTADLRLGPASTSCGCSSATISRGVVPAGGRATVAVEGQPPPSGTRTVRIAVATNDPARPTVTWTWDLTGHAPAPHLLTVPAVVDLGILRAEEVAPPQTVHIEVLEERATQPLARLIAAEPGRLRVEGGFAGEVGADDPRHAIRSYQYTVTPTAAPGVGRFVAEVRLMRGDIATPWRIIPVRGLVQPPVRVVPASIRLAPGGAESTRTLMVLSDGRRGAPEVECVDGDPALRIRVRDRGPDRVVFEVAPDGPGRTGPFRPLRFRVDRPVAMTLEVPVEPTP